MDSLKNEEKDDREKQFYVDDPCVDCKLSDDPPNLEERTGPVPSDDLIKKSIESSTDQSGDGKDEDRKSSNRDSYSCICLINLVSILVTALIT